MPLVETFTLALERSRRHEILPAIPVVRAFTVAPISLERLDEYLKEGLPLTYFSFSEVVMLAKSEQSVPSAGLLTVPGGWMAEGESVTGAALREIGEETMMLTQSISGVETAAGIPPYVFTIPGYHERREAHLVVVPVRSSSFSFHVPREGKEGPVDKISDLVTVSLPELNELLEKGHCERNGHRLQIVGHLTKAASEIRITPEERAKKNQALDGIYDEILGFEERLRQQILTEINRLRRLKHQPPVRDLANCTHHEIKNGFIAAQMALGMTDEHKREETGLVTPPPIADLPIVAEFLSAFDPEAMSEFVISLPTRRAYRGLRAFKQALRPTVADLYALLGKNAGEVNPNLYQALAEVWPGVLALSLDRRNRLLEHLNYKFMQRVAGNLGVSFGRVKHALAEAQENPQYYTQSLAALEAQFQGGRRMNEIANARLLTLVFMGLGLHPNLSLDPQKRPEVLRTLRFEAMVTLADFLAAVEAIEIKEKADNSLIEGALDTFFKFPPQPEVIILGNGILHPVYHRETRVNVGERSLHLVVDERLVKDEHSIMRKRYQEPEIFDLFSINLVLAEDNFGGREVPAAVRLALVSELEEALLAHIRQEVGPNGWEVAVVSGTPKDTFSHVREYLQIKDRKKQQELVNSLRRGKRPGSSGDLIVRKKFVLALVRAEEVRYCEFCIYPYEQLEEGVGELSGSGFWGFREKLTDDATGIYNAMRLIARDRKAPTRPSLYELEFPPFLYEWRILRMMRRQIKSHRGLPHLEDTIKQWFLQRWFAMWRK
ncbi:MAG: NUDIX hydrolase [Patescibacteria group bacterium]